MTTNITGCTPTHPSAQTPTVVTDERGYERLADESSKRDSLMTEFKPHLRMRRAEAKELAQGQIIYTHYISSDEHEPPENIQEMQRTRFASPAEAEAALDKLDGIVSFFAPAQARAFIETVRQFAEHAGQNMRSVRISVTMGMNFTGIDGIAPDAADRLVAERMREALKEKRPDLLVETRVIPTTSNRAVVLRWEAFDGPASTNATLARHLARHTEF
ncbi:hypothetical protein [Bordetella sp. N]|uniref:hypothetical protein n=1 Tax=Bordetella sp. N TaxID=1746199 RepID=UPI00070C157F|nr:hypothetical protein [Bordetella sp. N]ALM86223.1 hypothetical protein ASB57_27665 [Bordetella sp. N]